MGGLFGLEVASGMRSEKPACMDHPALLLANAGSAIALLVDRLAPKRVWMPSYLCDSMVAAVNPAAARLRYYEMTDRLTPAGTDFMGQIEQGDLVFFIAYFGFPHDAERVASARARGAWIVKDACQAMVSEDGRRNTTSCCSARASSRREIRSLFRRTGSYRDGWSSYGLT